IDTLLAAGLSESVTRQLLWLLRDRGPLENEAWLRIRALFAIGFLQPDNAEEGLRHVLERVAGRVIAGTTNRAEITELQETLFTTADVFGANASEDRAVLIRGSEFRQRIQPILDDLANSEHIKEPGGRPIARALAYLLTFMAQSGRTDLS